MLSLQVQYSQSVQQLDSWKTSQSDFIPSIPQRRNCNAMQVNHFTWKVIFYWIRQFDLYRHDCSWEIMNPPFRQSIPGSINPLVLLCSTWLAAIHNKICQLANKTEIAGNKGCWLTGWLSNGIGNWRVVVDWLQLSTNRYLGSQSS